MMMSCLQTIVVISHLNTLLISAKTVTLKFILVTKCTGSSTIHQQINSIENVR